MHMHDRLVVEGRNVSNQREHFNLLCYRNTVVDFLRRIKPCQRCSVYRSDRSKVCVRDFVLDDKVCKPAHHLVPFVENHSIDLLFWRIFYLLYTHAWRLASSDETRRRDKIIRGLTIGGTDRCDDRAYNHEQRALISHMEYLLLR